MSHSYFTIVLFLTFTNTAVGNNVSDHHALLQLKAKITYDPLGFMTSWNDTTHFCQWPGVTCSNRHHQRVTSLDLPSLKLSGSLSPQIGNLSFLKVLQLQNNSFSHEIPHQIGHLQRLQYMRLDNNSFIGNIPVNLSSCSNLSRVSLSRNQLVGEVPAEIGSLISLKILLMQSNHLTGEIPPSLGNLSSLLKLSLADNYFHGSIPHPLGQLRNVSEITLALNKLSGIIPPSVFNISSITLFEVGFNQIQGSLPIDLGNMLPNLKRFAAGQNRFTGTLPISISNASNLEYLDLGNNSFYGKVPALEKLKKLEWLVLAENHVGSRGIEDDLSFLCSLTNATSLEYLYLTKNNFGGMLPQCICNLSTTITDLVLEGNYIVGSIPTGIESFKHLTILALSHNQLSGTIPASIGKLKNLVKMAFWKNNLFGHLPSSLGNLTQLIKLDLSMNNLQGSIPVSLGNCQKLLELDLSNNNLSGVIPSAIVKISSLASFLDLSQNHLTGPLPMEIEHLKNIGALDVSGNMLSGQIPTSLGGCTSLEILLMQENQFQGTIPSTLSSLRALQVLDLSRNNLSGKIPEFFTGTLSSLNLSYNGFEGMLPTTGPFSNATTTSIIGNNKLCGGIPEFHLPPCNLQNSRKKKQKLIITVVCGILAVSSLLFLLVVLWFTKRRKETTALSLEASMFKVSYQGLLKATNGFSTANLIGVGSFGSVYKGVIDQVGIVAVKVLNVSRKGASKSFIAECKALRNIRHRNLVKVLTACSTIDHNGNDFKALVYEFMVNKSLEAWLHPLPIMNEENEASRNLDFLQRLNIVIDVACALEYLHHHCETLIVHCDLKPSNILLDNDMVAHVGDFGLAKFLSESIPNNSTNQSSSIGIRGTVGYAPPEYALGCEVSAYGDVYSFGILLFEIFTRKRPIDDDFQDGMNLRNYVMQALPNQIAEITDPTLFEMRVEEHTYRANSGNQRKSRNEMVLDCLSSIFKIGISCSTKISKERIDIGKVVIELSSIRDKFLRT